MLSGSVFHPDYLQSFQVLGSGDGSCFWSVGVSQSGYSSVLAVVGEFVTFWESFLCPGVLDCFSVSLLRKTGYGLGPVVAAVRVAVVPVSLPSARRVTVMLSGRIPSWLSASAQILVMVALVWPGV